MGCCFSSSITKKEESLAKGKPAAASATVHRNPVVQRDSRPPETEAEETVKEVLLETSRPRSTPPLPTTRTSACEDANSKEVEIIEKGYATGVPLNGIAPLSIDSSNGCDSISEDASEAWSVSAKSETLSASATKAERRRGAVAEAGMRATREERSPAKYQRKRSVSGDFACRRDRSVAVGCGSGRSSFSPAGRRSEHAAVARTNSAREFSSSRASRPGATRDLGERSGRRSVSPVMKRAAELGQRGGQCRAPGASAVRANGTKQQMPGDEGEKKLCVKDEGIVGGEAAGSAGEAKESLENPLVSLECFIFL
ncbi:uncharacterized protein LOC135616154 [Musa acuminata AAA Group]|uniref:uncharacterized protein LOC135616154 n=1 Tax=Musa acuminata AAA Group TaxID=214697 RepID=UPI0031DC502E